MIGVLCLHGFTGSTKEVEPLVEFFKRHTNWIVKSPTLPGHGETLRLKGVQYNEWIRHAENELLLLLDRCERVYVCGFSMGGLIGSWLSIHYPVEKLVLLSAAAFYTNPKKICKEIVEMVVDGFRNSFEESELFQKYKRKFLATPFSAYYQFRKLVHTIRPSIRYVQVPTLIAQGKNDPIVPEKSAHFLYQTICANEKK